MPTNLPNRARITFNGSDVILSNETNTTLVDKFTMNIEKNAVTPTVVPGGSAVYAARMDNTGEGSLYNPSFTDDLGGGRLTYVPDSALFFLNGAPVTGTAMVLSETELVLTADVILGEGDTFMVLYAADVSSSQTEAITNTVTGSANGGGETGCEVSGSSEATVTIEDVVNVSIFKSASEETVSCGDTLTYTFTLMNGGTEAAENISFTDALPEQFTVESVSITAKGGKTPVLPTDYTITEPNTLVIPAAGSALEISVPASDSEGPGITVITVTGTIG